MWNNFKQRIKFQSTLPSWAIGTILLCKSTLKTCDLQVLVKNSANDRLFIPTVPHVSLISNTTLYDTRKQTPEATRLLSTPFFWLTRLSISDFKCFCGITTSAAIWFPLSHFGMDFISSSLRLRKIRDDCGQAAVQLGLPYTETSLTVVTSSYLFVTY